VAASDDERGGENCMRIRVRMEVNRPLCRGCLVNLDEGKQGWVAFRYERLPNFCYWCGCLDHGEKDCDIGLQQRHSSTKEEFQYGAWLRATSDCPPRKTVVIVPGNQPKSRANSTRADHPSHQPATEMEDLNCERNEKGKASDVMARDLENDMEIEPNPGFPLQVLVRKSNADTFNDQLKEIDQAINYMPYEENVREQVSNLLYAHNSTNAQGAKLAGPREKKNASPLSSLHRRPLEDISNGSNTKQKPRSSTTKWKKLA
jgi:hypothetical protein